MNEAEKEFDEFYSNITMPGVVHSYESLKDLALRSFLAGRKSIKDRRCKNCKHCFRPPNYYDYCVKMPTHVINSDIFYCKYWESKQ